MITAPYSILRRAEHDYPGILKQLRQLESAPLQTITTALTGRTICLTALTTQFQISAQSSLNPEPWQT